MIEQFAIAATGVTAIWFTQSKAANVRRYACLFGLAGQPFWFWSAISAQQWGIVILCCFYTAAWARGVKTNWIDKPAPVKQEACPFCGGTGGHWEGCRAPVDTSTHPAAGDKVREEALGALYGWWVIGEMYTTIDIPGERNPCTYVLEWIDRSHRSHGVALWRHPKKHTLHLQNVSDFQTSSVAQPQEADRG